MDTVEQISESSRSKDSTLEKPSGVIHFHRSIQAIKTQGNSRILLVDDDIQAQDWMKAILSTQLAFESRCDQVLSGKEAIDSIRLSEEYGLSYALILIDIEMPIMDGFETAKEMIRLLREEYGYAEDRMPKIVGLSGKIDQKLKEVAEDSGITQLINKPVSQLRIQ